MAFCRIRFDAFRFVLHLLVFLFVIETSADAFVLFPVHLAITPSLSRTNLQPLYSSFWYNDPAVLWSLRLGSGLFTYTTLIAFLDRPQGTLLVNQNCIQVRPSAVAGLGLFATADMPAGTVLGTYPGMVVSLNDRRIQQKAYQYPYCQTYMWRFSDNSALIDPTNAVGDLEDYCTSTTAPFLFRNPTTLCRINEPPLGRDVNVVTEENRDQRIVVLRLERNVMAGEELFMDYGPQYDRSGYGG